MAMFFPFWKTSALTDITKPYLGEYECEQAYFGKEDVLDNFDFIRLELKEDGTFTLYYCEENGKKQTQDGKYTYDKESETLSMTVGKWGIFKRKFPLDHGEITINMRIGMKNLQLKFRQK